MEEQSDTPRTDAAEQFVSYFGWQVHADFVRDLERELAAATRERDEAIALNAQWAEKAATWMASPEAAQRLQGYRDLAQQVATAQNERDEARAEVAEIESVLRASGALNQKLLDEVDRLRALTICGCGDHFNAAFRGLCPNCVSAGKVAP